MGIVQVPTILPCRPLQAVREVPARLSRALPVGIPHRLWGKAPWGRALEDHEPPMYDRIRPSRAGSSLCRK
jgi:hypothetical protein